MIPEQEEELGSLLVRAVAQIEKLTKIVAAQQQSLITLSLAVQALQKQQPDHK